VGTIANKLQTKKPAPIEEAGMVKVNSQKIYMYKIKNKRRLVQQATFNRKQKLPVCEKSKQVEVENVRGNHKMINQTF
jgi:hypothetical protein